MAIELPLHEGNNWETTMMQKQSVKSSGHPVDSINNLILLRNVHRQQGAPCWSQLQNDLGKF